MEDPQNHRRADETDEERQRREQRAQEEELERLLLAQEEDDDDDDDSPQRDHLGGEDDDGNGNGNEDGLMMMNDRNLQRDNNNNEFGGIDPNNGMENDPLFDPFQQQQQQNPLTLARGLATNRISYVQASFGAALGQLYYALRTRQQWYLAMVYMSSSKFTYIVWGNALVAACISVFFGFCNFFLKGLRLLEAEGLGDFFRWNITETCLALTMFRSSLNVQTGCYFVGLVCLKCLHWVVGQREGYLRLTKEAVVVLPGTQLPGINGPFVKLLGALIFLQIIDIWAVTRCIETILKDGATVAILFAFETTILLVSALSHVLLWNLHLLDGMLHYLHETTSPTSFIHHMIHPWKDHRATLVFAVEVQAQAAKFLFYLAFFSIVWSYYGVPINLIREVYVSFQQLRQRLKAFSKYRKLMSSMKQFANPSEEKLEEAGSTCIICRDEMSVHTSKQLPGCGHIFHKSCLREWLVQQQTCPTCRADFSSLQARQRQQDALDRANNQDDATEDDAGDDNNDGDHSHACTHDHDHEQPADEAAERTLNVAELAEEQAQRMRDAALAMAGREQESRNIVRSAVMPTAPLESAAGTENHVRFSFTEDATGTFDAGVFPAFYRVVREDGAEVWNNGTLMSFVIRQVPCGMIILGQEHQWRTCGDDDDTPQFMVRMPDGWIRESQVKRIVAVPLSA